MSSHVVVIDSSARRATVKVTPSKHLSDILSEACAKFGYDTSHYGLRHKNKHLDLSLSFRLSGLTAGAKLELVQTSRSPSVVSVALQLPECEASGAPNGRLIDKFPSTTTLWAVLRKFEAGVAGNSRQRNLTARAAPSSAITSGPGRLFYEMPVINVMGRELCQFTDLQKTLGQLGYNNGSVLLRLAFRLTDQPLEEAMKDITIYFHSVEEDTPGPNRSEQQQDISPKEPFAALQQAASSISSPGSTNENSMTAPDPPSTRKQQQIAENQNTPAVTDVTSRPTTVYAPPTSTTPQAVMLGYDENDYLPTIDHAKAHQRNLKTASQPTRLASDAELEAQKEAAEARLAAVQSVEVKIRFPDQSQVVSTFTREDSGADLHSFVRGCLDTALSGEQFHLTFLPTTASNKGGRADSPSQTVVPDNPAKLLIRDLRMMGRVLVNFSWDADSSKNRVSLLKPELRAAAGQIKVREPEAVPVNEDISQERKGTGESKGSKSSTEIRKLPRWLKLPGKK
ncbi:hypothetical protein KEM54_000475 [Ascosphaera aggregata]|nr:hypothetical protein KEM54_000475 [Ascosphaera aggregata]